MYIVCYLDLGANDHATVKREQVRTFRINSSGGVVKVELNAVSITFNSTFYISSCGIVKITLHATIIQIN